MQASSARLESLGFSRVQTTTEAKQASLSVRSAPSLAGALVCRSKVASKFASPSPSLCLLGDLPREPSLEPLLVSEHRPSATLSRNMTCADGML